MTHEELDRLIEHLRTLPRETEWVEFKRNKADPEEIGEYVSALSNGAALNRQNRAYIVWGIEDGTHHLVGTSVRLRETKVGNEELENWILRLLTPRIDIRIVDGEVEGKPIALMEILPASNQPVGFKGTEYIRVGTYKKKLKDYPEKERELWSIFSQTPFEDGVALEAVHSDDVLSLLDYTAAFRLLEIPLPDNRAAVFDRLLAEGIVVRAPGDRYDVTNIGAILFATDLRRFGRLARKAPRVVIYHGDNRTQTVKEQEGSKGYAVGFEGLLAYINDQLPQNEEIGQALRKQVRLYPEVAIRELVANALIHQDFHLTGAGPMVEIFTDRMEITNPGLPLIDTLRFIDEPPRSRNERLAGLMRRMNICEERGSGIDKVILNVEVFQLPAPDFRTTSQHTVAMLFGPRSFAEMDRKDRIRACYQHACLCYVSGKSMTNTTLRERLRIEKQNYPQASRIIRDAIDAGLLKQAGGTRKDASYVPFWA